jgi:hypothetical protein
VPPIYQPEVAARAVADAAERPRRELWVGGSTVQAIVGNRLAPGLLDRYLARTGYDAQQTAEPVEPDRPDNLDDPLPGDRGAHGRFDAEARPSALRLAVGGNGGLVAGVAVATAALLVLRRRR